MARIHNLSSKLTLNTSGFVRPLDKARDRISKFTRDFGGGVGRVTRMGAKLGVLGAGLLGVGSVAAGLTLGAKLTAEAEQAEVAFGTMLGSADAAKAMMADLNQFAASTPFDLPGLTDAAKKLIAFGSAPDQVIPELRAIGDIAAGVGVPVGDLAEIYGKARTSGRLMAEDINQLTGRGIPIIKALADQFGVAESEIKGMVSEGKIGFPQLQQAFADMTGEGGQFAGMMDAQSKTLSGLFSTLTDTVGMVARTVVGGFFEKINLKGLIADLTAAMPVIEKTTSMVTGFAVDTLGTLFGRLQSIGGESTSTGNKIIDAMAMGAKGVAVVADWIDAARYGYDLLRLGVVKFQKISVRGIGEILELASKLPDWLGGGIAADAAGIADMFAAELDQEIIKLQSAIHERLVKPSNAEQVERFFAKVKQEAQAAGEAAAHIELPALKIDAQVEQPLADIEKISGHLADLDKQIERFGLSDIEIKIADLAELGATTDQLELARQKLEQIARMERDQKRQEDITSQLAELESQVSTFGLSDNEKQLLDLEALGASADQLERARQSMQELDRLAKQQDQEQRRQESQPQQLTRVNSAEAQRLAFQSARGLQPKQDDTPKRQLDAQTRMAATLERIEQNQQNGGGDEWEL